MSLLPGATTCCDPCDEPVSVAVPGPAGSDGAAGAAGAAGVNAYTLTTVQFTMPAEAATVTVTVGSSAWAVLNQVVAAYVGGAFGYFEVTAKPSSTQMTLQNLKNTASGTYSVNSAPGTVFAIGTQISPAGLQGVSGTAASAAPVGATYIVQTPDGTLTSEQALSLLATGIVYNTTGTGVLSIAALGTNYYGAGMGVDVPVSEGGTGASNAAGAQTNLGLVIGTNVQAQDATLQSISALGTAADRYAYTTGVDTWAEGTITAAGRTLLDDADAAAQRTTLALNRAITDWILIEEQFASGTAGGTFTSGAWRTRALNTEVADTGNYASVAASQVTLAAGTYRFRASAIGHDCNAHQIRLQNITAGTTIAYGLVNQADAANQVANTSAAAGRFTIAGATVLELQHQCTTTRATDGMGVAGSYGGTEVYSSLELEREAG